MGTHNGTFASDRSTKQRPFAMMKLSLVAITVIAVAFSLPAPERQEELFAAQADEWEEIEGQMTALAPAACTTSGLATAYANAAETATTGEKCTAKSMCHAIQLLDKARQDTNLPCVESEGANCQQSFYSAYKCKASMVDASNDASQETVKSSTGAMCTGNSPGMITSTETACGRVLAGYRGTVSHGQLFNWMVNIAGPKMFSKISHDAMCSVTRKRRGTDVVKYALLNCDNLPAIPDPVIDPNAEYDPYKTAGAVGRL